MKNQRNQSCSCGSGKKYKACCGVTTEARSNKGALMAVAIFAIVAVIALASTFLGDSDAGTDEPGPGKIWSEAHGHWHDVDELPPGPAPEGKVWSEGHGHWHDPAPVGPAPEGKVWSPDHGHWHDPGQSDDIDDQE